MNFEKILIIANKFSKTTIAIRFILKEYALEEKLERKQGRSVLPPEIFKSTAAEMPFSTFSIGHFWGVNTTEIAVRR